MQLCFNEYWRRVLGLVPHAGTLGVLIGEYVKPARNSFFGSYISHLPFQPTRTRKEPARMRV